MSRILRWLRGEDIDPADEIRKGGIGHNEVVPAIAVMTPEGLRAASCAPISVCSDGHVEVIGEPEVLTEIRCVRCQRWTWEDGNYCVRCGARRTGT